MLEREASELGERYGMELIHGASFTTSVSLHPQPGQFASVPKGHITKTLWAWK